MLLPKERAYGLLQNNPLGFLYSRNVCDHRVRVCVLRQFVHECPDTRVGSYKLTMTHDYPLPTQFVQMFIDPRPVLLVVRHPRGLEGSSCRVLEICTSCASPIGPDDTPSCY